MGNAGDPAALAMQYGIDCLRKRRTWRACTFVQIDEFYPMDATAAEQLPLVRQ